MGQGLLLRLEDDELRELTPLHLRAAQQQVQASLPVRKPAKAAG